MQIQITVFRIFLESPEIPFLWPDHGFYSTLLYNLEKIICRYLVKWLHTKSFPSLFIKKATSDSLKDVPKLAIRVENRLGNNYAGPSEKGDEKLASAQNLQFVDKNCQNPSAAPKNVQNMAPKTQSENAFSLDGEYLGALPAIPQLSMLNDLQKPV